MFRRENINLSKIRGYLGIRTRVNDSLEGKKRKEEEEEGEWRSGQELWQLGRSITLACNASGHVTSRDSNSLRV